MRQASKQRPFFLLERAFARQTTLTQSPSKANSTHLMKNATVPPPLIFRATFQKRRHLQTKTHVLIQKLKPANLFLLCIIINYTFLYWFFQLEN